MACTYFPDSGTLRVRLKPIPIRLPHGLPREIRNLLRDLDLQTFSSAALDRRLDEITVLDSNGRPIR